MFNRILVPLDGSSNAAAALPVAHQLARESSGTLILVRALRPLAEVEMGITQSDGWVPAADPAERDEASAYLRQVASSLGGVAVETVVGAGAANGIILDATRRQAADLIVMTSRERTGLARWMLGSVARGVLRAAEVPVLILRAAEGKIVSPISPRGEGAGRRAMVPLDGSSLAEAALAPAAQLVAQLSVPERAQIDLLRVVEIVPTLGAAPYALGAPGGFGLTDDLYVEGARVAHEYLNEVAARLRREEADKHIPALASITETVVLGLNVADTIAAVAEGRESSAGEGGRERSDLIAVATHGRSGLKRLILGSVTERLLDSTAVPVLVAPPKIGAD